MQGYHFKATSGFPSIVITLAESIGTLSTNHIKNSSLGKYFHMSHTKLTYTSKFANKTVGPLVFLGPNPAKILPITSHKIEVVGIGGQTN